MIKIKFMPYWSMYWLTAQNIIHEFILSHSADTCRHTQ
jgi:hypothetical protein